jgi:hypothetical protein
VEPLVEQCRSLLERWTLPNLDHAALRLLEIPEVVTVLRANGVPRVLEWRGVRQTLTRATGPERLTGDWWRPDAFAREYWRCRVDGEGDVLLYQERGRGSCRGGLIEASRPTAPLTTRRAPRRTGAPDRSRTAHPWPAT